MTLTDDERARLHDLGWSDAEVAAVDDDLLRDVLANAKSTLSATPKTATASVEYADDADSGE